MPDRPRSLHPMRSFNKYVLNRLTRRFARFSRGPIAVIHHVGRRSGKPYETPVLAEPVPGGFVLALTYGPDVDWYRNIMAAGRCRIQWHGNEYAIDKIVSMDKQAALPAFPQPFRLMLGVLGTPHFVRMNYSPTSGDAA